MIKNKINTEIIIDEAKWLELLPNADEIIPETVKIAWNDTGINKNGIPQISVFLQNDKNIQKINKEYRGLDKPTNVLSFPAMEEDIIFAKDMPFLAGDIILALETCKKEADAEKITFADHVVHLLVHGVLHLAGFDHIKDSEAEIMEAKETLILAKMGIKNPYAN